MVRLTKIYTRQGDGGETHLGDMTRVPKSDPRVQAFGDVDETNAAIGVALTHPLPAGMAAHLTHIQNDLFDLGADLCVPSDAEGERLRIVASQVDRLERWCDEHNEPLGSLTSFILPGGSPAAAALHVARTVCRRAERSTVSLMAVADVNPSAFAYLNRLSDLLFILARTCNAHEGVPDVLWRPGGERGESGGSS